MDGINVSVLNEAIQNLGQSIGGDLGEWLEQIAQMTTIWLVVGIAFSILLYLIQAVLVGALARGKGYAFFGNFILGLFFGFVALVYEAGRPVSYERECVMQDRLAMQTAKELYRLQRAREKAKQQL